MSRVSPGDSHDSSASSRDERLDSWKEIARYLNRSVRTVQRWEQGENLPVHRLQHDKRGSVFGYRVELDEWWSRRRDHLQALDGPSPAGSITSHVNPLKSRPWYAAWAAIAAVASLTGAFVLLYSPNGARANLGQLHSETLTDYPGGEFDPSLSPDGQTVAFAWNGGEAEAPPHIFAKTINTGKVARLANGPDPEIAPAWSPDGTALAFVRQAGPSRAAVMLAPAEGGVERKLAEFGVASREAACAAIAWTPDSRFLVIPDDSAVPGPPGLALLSVDSGVKRCLTTAPTESNGDCAATVSPDGHSLVFSRRLGSSVSDLYQLTLADGFTPSGEPRRLTFSNQYNEQPVFTPDGHAIIFASGPWTHTTLWKLDLSSRGAPQPLLSSDEQGGEPTVSRLGARLAFVQTSYSCNIWRIGTSRPGEAAGPPIRLLGGASRQSNPQFSPDNRMIAFESDQSGFMEIWVADSGGSQPRQITSFHGPHTGTPRWSPDSRQIAFDSRPDGQGDIYVASVEGRHLRRITSHPSDDLVPSWSHDGRWIYFASNRGGSFEVWKTPAEGGTAVQVTRRGGFGPMESHDGGFLYYAKGTGQSALWRLPLQGGDEEMAVPSITDWSQFALSREGIYFVQTAKGTKKPVLQFLRFGKGRPASVLPLEGVYLGLSVSPDGKQVIYCRGQSKSADLRLVENFH